MQELGARARRPGEESVHTVPATACPHHVDGPGTAEVGHAEGAGDDDGDADARWAFRSAGDRRKPAFGLDQEIIGLAMRVGPFVAIACDGATDQLRIILAQALDAEAKRPNRPGLQILDEDVRRRGEVERRAPVLLSGMQPLPPDAVSPFSTRNWRATLSPKAGAGTKVCEAGGVSLL